ncbi:MAG: PorV/PorQ family protein [Candidatus Marinimicrobia bacterium]|jgi:hypothetical protein|nr:PorV/PorQ family protein [Candidatus Neomarinimicrobiota bacterium]
MRNKIAIMVLILSLFTVLFAKQIDNKVGTTSFQFLKIGVGARGNALGGANVSTANGPYSMYWNPAGICARDKMEVTFFNNKWIANINHSFLGATVPVTSNDYLGASLTFVNMGEMEETTITDPQGTGKYFSAADYALTMTYGRRVTDRFMAAISVKYINEQIWDLVSDGWAFDVGLIYNYNKFHVGMSFSNFGMKQDISGTQLEFDYQIYPEENVDEVTLGYVPKKLALPMSFRFGGAYDLVRVNYHKLAVMSSIYYSSDIGESENVGLEYSFMENYILRGGYQFEHEGYDWSVGAGVRFHIKNIRFEFDYATLNLRDFDLQHQTGLSVSF